MDGYKLAWETGLNAMDIVTGGKFSDMANKVKESFDKVKGWIDGAINKIRDWNNQRVENKQATFTTTIKQVFQTIGEKISNIGKMHKEQIIGEAALPGSVKKVQS